MKVVGPKGTLSPRWFILLTVLGRLSRCWSYSLLLCSTRPFVLRLALCYFVHVFFSPFSIAITSLGKRDFSAFPYVCSIRACLVLSISSSFWCLRKAAACVCGISWTFLLPFFLNVSYSHLTKVFIALLRYRYVSFNAFYYL